MPIRFYEDSGEDPFGFSDPFADTTAQDTLADTTVQNVTVSDTPITDSLLGTTSVQPTATISATNYVPEGIYGGQSTMSDANNQYMASLPDPYGLTTEEFLAQAKNYSQETVQDWLAKKAAVFDKSLFDQLILGGLNVASGGAFGLTKSAADVAKGDLSLKDFATSLAKSYVAGQLGDLAQGTQTYKDAVDAISTATNVGTYAAEALVDSVISGVASGNTSLENIVTGALTNYVRGQQPVSQEKANELLAKTGIDPNVGLYFPEMSSPVVQEGTLPDVQGDAVDMNLPDDPLGTTEAAKNYTTPTGGTIEETVVTGTDTSGGMLTGTTTEPKTPLSYDEWYSQVNTPKGYRNLEDANGNRVDGVYVDDKGNVVADPYLNDQYSEGSKLLLEEYVPAMQEKLNSGELSIGSAVDFTPEEMMVNLQARPETFLENLNSLDIMQPIVYPEQPLPVEEVPVTAVEDTTDLPADLPLDFSTPETTFTPPVEQQPVEQTPAQQEQNQGGGGGDQGSQGSEQQPIDPTQTPEYKQMESDLQSATDAKGQLENDLEATQSELDALQTEYDNLLDKTSEEAKSLKEDIDALQLGKESIQEELNAANGSIQELEGKLSDAQGTISGQQETIAGLKGDLQVAKEDYAALQEQGKADVAAAKAEGEAAVSQAKADGEAAVAQAKADGEAAVAQAKADGEAAVKAAESKGEEAVAAAKAAGEQAVKEAEAKAAADAKAAQEAADKALEDAKAAGQAAVDKAVADGKAAAEAAKAEGYGQGYGEGETVGYGTGYGEGYGTGYGEGEGAGFGRGQGMMTTQQSFGSSKIPEFKGYMGGLSYRKLNPYQAQDLIYQPSVVNSLFGDYLK